jgi:hypothetical protein
MTLGSTKPLTEMSTRNLPGSRMRPGRQDWWPHHYLLADSLEKCGSLDVLTTQCASTACLPFSSEDRFEGFLVTVPCSSKFHGPLSKYWQCRKENREQFCIEKWDRALSTISARYHANALQGNVPLMSVVTTNRVRVRNSIVMTERMPF